MTVFNRDAEIEHIGDGLRNRTLPKSEWTHKAHVAAAVWVLDQYGQAAEVVTPDMIRCYNESVGGVNSDQEGYHHTITLASLRAIASVAGRGSLCERTNRVLSAGFDRPDWLFRHYRRDRLFTVDARRGWVEPDLAPLPKQS